MRKVAYIDDHWGEGWPELKSIERYFIAPPGKQWVFDTGSPDGSFTLEGVDGTEELERNRGRIDVQLTMWGNPDLGVLLIYSKWGGGHEQTFSSKGDLNRLGEWVRTTQNDPMPIGLYIPFEKAWKAVKEFIQTDGQLPKSIEWIANRDLPPNTFPAPHEVKI